jgi:hypothetical protein
MASSIYIASYYYKLVDLDSNGESALTLTRLSHRTRPAMLALSALDINIKNTAFVFLTAQHHRCKRV